MEHETVEIAGWRVSVLDDDTGVRWALTPPWRSEPLTSVTELTAARPVIEAVNRARDTGLMTLHEVWLHLRSHSWSPTIPEHCTACALGPNDPLTACTGADL